MGEAPDFKPKETCRVQLSLLQLSAAAERPLTCPSEATRHLHGPGEQDGIPMQDPRVRADPRCRSRAPGAVLVPAWDSSRLKPFLCGMGTAEVGTRDTAGTCSWQSSRSGPTAPQPETLRLQSTPGETDPQHQTSKSNQSSAEVPEGRGSAGPSSRGRQQAGVRAGPAQVGVAAGDSTALLPRSAAHRGGGFLLQHAEDKSSVIGCSPPTSATAIATEKPAAMTSLHEAGDGRAAPGPAPGDTGLGTAASALRATSSSGRRAA